MNCEPGSSVGSLPNQKGNVLSVPKFFFFFFIITLIFTTNIAITVTDHFYHHSMPTHSFSQFPKNLCIPCDGLVITVTLLRGQGDISIPIFPVCKPRLGEGKPLVESRSSSGLLYTVHLQHYNFTLRMISKYLTTNKAWVLTSQARDL